MLLICALVSGGSSRPRLLSSSSVVGRGCAGQVDGERGLIADREFVGDAVAIAVDVVTDDFDRLHARARCATLRD